ncbi:Putative zn(2)Cys(6) fungal-type DNA-binding domain-containing protein [Colletotrichum destructivum]|uniref:Zn(2)Cys(6) fungal-type DNA-binding domain-containing protein n=1 Tax=Colletotrichum destructivum TaxID=34406 RepID=A0AAX4I0Z0_9PEZI|nr:Putative zn(2)Cys(6) fungal-type DNA-binding domain-containing protein [Colletotrichum destructivum]
MPKQQREQLSGRRSHRKSKHGCGVCKKRHIKCDETRPECRNCVMGERLCSYLAPGSNPISLLPSTTNSVSTPSSVASDHVLVVPRDTAEGLLCPGPTFTATHMAFLHYAESNMSDYMALQGSVQPMIDTAVEHALTAPYLLDQLLALSALHLSTQDVAQASSFRHQATELQTRALGLFNQAKDHISESTYMPNFLFASLLGIHVLYETLQQRQDTLAKFTDDFVGYLRLHRGVRAIIAKDWQRLSQSNLKPLMYIAALSERADSRAPGEETKQFRKFLESSSTSSTAAEACLSALSRIQWVLDLTNQEPSRFDVGTHAVMAWPLVIPDKYIEALHQHRPEALVVLAFYAAILHRCRRYWVFGHSGSFLIHLVSRTVGSFWQDALAWPLQVLSDA